MKTINSDTIVYVLTAIGRHDDAQRDIQNMPIDCVYEDGRRVFLDPRKAEEARRQHEETDDLDATYHVTRVEAEDVPDHILEVSGYRIS